jgi:hypothetical protein
MNEIEWQAREIQIAASLFRLNAALDATQAEIDHLLSLDTGLDPELSVLAGSFNFMQATVTRIADLLSLRWDARRDARAAREDDGIGLSYIERRTDDA